MPNLSEDELKELLRGSEAKVDVKHSQMPGPNPMIALAQKQQPRANKYHAVRTFSQLCQRTFDSKAEATRGEELALMEKAEQIKHLRYQVKFMLCYEPIVSVTIDFAYLVGFNDNPFSGDEVFEDVKGYLTRDSRTRYAWLKEKYYVDVTLIR